MRADLTSLPRWLLPLLALPAWGGCRVSSFTEITADNPLGSLGGLRFTPARQNHLNSRFGFAVGKDSQAHAVGVGEAL